jgi:DNA-binding CsgD family transcriptional regulator
MAASDPAALEAVAGRFAAAGAGLLAAEAQAAAARAYAGQGHTDHARHAAARARQLAAACPGASTPLLHAPPPPAPGLTAREQQVAQLAAKGLTSDQIAQQLVISVRTAESHLYHAFRKLGVHTRDELQALLADGASAARPASSTQAP